MHRAEYFTESFSIEDGLLTRFVTAYWKDFKNIVYKENENDECWIKNFACIYMQGWLISIPGEIEHDNWGGRWEVEDEKYYEISNPRRITHPGDYRRGKQTALVKELSSIAVELYPDFSYVLKKYKVYETHVLMQILTVWKKHPEIELLLAKGFFNIAMSPGFLKLTDKTRKKYLQFIKTHPREYAIKFGDLRQIVNYENSLKDWKAYQSFLNECYAERIGISYPIYSYLNKIISSGKWSDYRYCNKQMSISVYYKDYLRMAKEAGHNIQDKYWRYPSDLVESHNKVMREVEAIHEQKRLAEEMARKIQADKEAKARVRAMALLRKKFKDYNLNIDGYQIFVSTDFEEWQKHAKALSQCIVAGGYYEGTADGRYTIVFIQKDGVPVATAEVLTNGKICQFYADERDRENCLPSKEVKEAFNKWLEAVPKTKFKKRQKKAA